MQIPDIIKDSLDYIERNLKTDITADELARMANYSAFHYYRLFSSVMESSVAGYILKRRLDHALGEMAEGRKAIDVVLEYGFETYAGSTRLLRRYTAAPRRNICRFTTVIDRKNRRWQQCILKKNCVISWKTGMPRKTCP